MDSLVQSCFTGMQSFKFLQGYQASVMGFLITCNKFTKMEGSSSLEKLRGYFNQGHTQSYQFRKEQLSKLKAAILEYEEELYEALRQDLKKSREESWVTELGFVMGQKNDGTIVFASETCAFDITDTHYVRDVAPGEMVVVDSFGTKPYFPFTERKNSLCIFEFIYFSRPDS